MILKMAKAAWKGSRGNPPCEFSLRQNLLMRARWAMMAWDDAVPDDLPDKWYVPEWMENGLRWLCSTLRAHEPEDDQCMIPDHRFCMICSARTPSAPTRNLTWA